MDKSKVPRFLAHPVC